MIRIRRNLILTMVACSITPSCKTQEPRSSKIKSAFSCNIADSEKASDEASKAAMSCAYNALKSAGELAGPGFAQNVQLMFEGLSDVRQGIELAQELINEIADFVQNKGVLPSSSAGFQLDDSGGQGEEGSSASSSGESNPDFSKIDGYVSSTDDAKRAFEDGVGVNKRTAMYQCLNGQYVAAKSFYAITKLAIGMKSQEKISAEMFHSMTQFSYDFTQIVFQLIEGNGRCAEWLGQKRMIALQKALKGIEKLQAPIKAIRVVGDCAIDIVRGGYVAVANSVCAVRDIQNYYESKGRLEETKNSYGARPIIDNESGVNACMAKYGLFLQKQSFYSYIYRSNVCGDYCGNGSKGAAYFPSNIDRIYTLESDRDFCRANASVALEKEVITRCVSYCCDQDSECTRSGLSRAGF